MIVIPMMGRSSRFFDAGYKRPKYELELFGKSVLDHVVESFSNYFKTEHFLFIVREDFNANGFVESCLGRHDISSFEVVTLTEETLGQAHTVYLGLCESQYARTSPLGVLAIFNADSFLTNFQMPSESEIGAGMLEVFIGDGDHWSFVRPGNDHSVLETREKVRISNLCSDGLYFFRNLNTFKQTFEKMERNGETERGEFYIAPMYNYLIEDGEPVTYRVIDRDTYWVCGTPSEYEFLLEMENRGSENPLVREN